MMRSRRTSWDSVSSLGSGARAARVRLTAGDPGPRANHLASYQETAFRPIGWPLSWVVVDKLK